MARTLISDLLAPGLRVVFCGTALGTHSFKAQAYYAKPGNRFWPTLYEIGLTPRQFEPSEYKLLLEHGVGLTDLSKSAYGVDSSLAETDFDVDATKAKIKLNEPDIWAFTSKKAASVYFGKSTSQISYGLQERKVGATRLFVLCSPSGLASSYWDVEIWKKLSRLIKL